MTPALGTSNSKYDCVSNIKRKILLNFLHRKALLAYSFPSVIRPLVTFQESYFLRDTLQVIPILMIPISSFYHVRGLKKGWSDRQILGIIIYILYRILSLYSNVFVFTEKIHGNKGHFQFYQILQYTYLIFVYSRKA